jgi:hypothetical protein
MEGGGFVKLPAFAVVGAIDSVRFDEEVGGKLDIFPTDGDVVTLGDRVGTREVALFVELLVEPPLAFNTEGATLAFNSEGAELAFPLRTAMVGDKLSFPPDENDGVADNITGTGVGTFDFGVVSIISLVHVRSRKNSPPGDPSSR